MDSRPIGVFDSGVGGLTVLRALRGALPGEHFIYLGDTARLPYGTKSRDTVLRYAIQAASHLVARNVKALVIACNTASASALDHLRRTLAPVPVVGVIEPGARTACSLSQLGRIAVLGTERTIRDGAYEAAIRRLNPRALVRSLACPLLVALAEEGWIDDGVARAVAGRYVGSLLGEEPQWRPDTVVLGCTHFPVLRSALEHAAGPGVKWVDSAASTATEVVELLAVQRLAAARGEPGEVRFLATDDADRFGRVAPIFLGEPVPVEGIELVDL